MSVPPELMAMLQGAHGAPQGAPSQAGPPAPPRALGGSGGGDEHPAVQILRQMIQLAQQYMQVEPDPEDKATMAQVHSTLLKYMAKDQADMQKVMGNPSVARVIGKAVGG